MRATITRKMIVSEIFGYAVQIDENGEPKVTKLDSVKVCGNIKSADALKVLKKSYPDKEGITVGKIVSDEAQYEISVEDFMKHATKIEQLKMDENGGNE